MLASLDEVFEFFKDSNGVGAGVDAFTEVVPVVFFVQKHNNESFEIILFQFIDYSF